MTKMLRAGVMIMPNTDRKAGLLVCSCSNDGVLSLHVIDHQSSSQAVSGRGDPLASEVLRHQGSSTAPLVAVKMPADVFSSLVCFDGFIFLGCRDNSLHCLTIA